jgi:hypothetical protein
MKNIFAKKLILNLHLNGTFIKTDMNTIIQITFLHFKNVIKILMYMYTVHSKRNYSKQLEKHKKAHII